MSSYLALKLGYINKTNTRIHKVELKTLYFNFVWLLQNRVFSYLSRGNEKLLKCHLNHLTTFCSRVIVPKGFRTFHDQCPVHIRVLAVFTGTFGVKGGGRFRTTTFCFLTVVFSVVVALLDAFSFSAILRSHFLLLLFS